MDVPELVASAIEGDVDAFTALVQRYQVMAFGYAYATLGDFDLAEDAAQQAFIVAYRNLSNLRQPERFGGWLRGIVRYECLHLLRRQHRQRWSHLSIDDALGIPTSMPGPEEIAEQQESFDLALAAINGLPESERVVAILYYIRDHSQRDVAQFLNLPVSVVNNRLRSARKHLREGGFFPMTKDALAQHDLPKDFADRVGKVIRTQGPFIDARFPKDTRPTILNAVTITNEATGLSLTAQVAQYLDDDLVRLITMNVPDRLKAVVGPGTQVLDTGSPVSLPLDDESLLRLIPMMRRKTTRHDVIETGIKAIDLFCPLPSGGLIGLAGDMNSGKIVLVEELIQRLEGTSHHISIVVFVQTPKEVTVVQQFEYRASRVVDAIYVPVVDASPEALFHVMEHLDAAITLSSGMATQGLYPAIDPLRSTSTVLISERVGHEQFDVVEDAKRLLGQASTGLDTDHHDETGASLESHARQIQWYLTQPFYVAEAFTNRPGRTVGRDIAVADIRQLLGDVHLDLGKDELYMTGSLVDSVEHSR